MFGIVAAIGGFISSAISTVGTAIATAASALITKLPPLIVEAKIIVDVIAGIISKVAEALGITQKEENLEELGAKAMQDGTRAKLEGETTQEYLDYLRKDVKLDEEKYAEMSDKERLACNALGTTMVSKAIEEKTGVEVPPEFLYTIHKSNLKFEQVEKILDSFSKNGIESMGHFTKYISNDLSEEQAYEIGSVVKESLSELSPELSDDEIQEEIVEMKRAYNREEI